MAVMVVMVVMVVMAGTMGMVRLAVKATTLSTGSIMTRTAPRRIAWGMSDEVSVRLLRARRFSAEIQAALRVNSASVVML